MARLGRWCVLIGLGLGLLGCEAPKKTEPPSAEKPETMAAAERAAEPEMSDDQLCAWMCANCFSEYAGLVEYPGDCRGMCIAQVTTKPCAEMLRAKVTCQVLAKSCDSCEAEKQAALQCLRDCDKMRRVQGEASLPPHCKDATP